MKSRKVRRQARPGRFTEENWEDLLDRHGRARRGSDDLPGHPSAGDEPESAYDEDAYASAGIVISVSSGRCRVFYDGSEIDCLVPPEIAVRQKSALAVGDRVLIYRDGDVW